jgi:serine/threonine protein kinase
MEKRIAHYTYQLRDFLGKGSYSNVYKCVDDLTQETLAIKIIEKRLM